MSGYSNISRGQSLQTLNNPHSLYYKVSTDLMISCMQRKAFSSIARWNGEVPLKSGVVISAPNTVGVVGVVGGVGVVK